MFNMAIARAEPTRAHAKKVLREVGINIVVHDHRFRFQCPFYLMSIACGLEVR